MSDDPYALVMFAATVLAVLAGVIRYVTFDPAHARSRFADPRLVRALELGNAGNQEAALSLWEEVIRTGNPPGRATAYASRASCRLSADRVDEAIADLDEAIRLAPTYPDAYIWRAAAWMRKQDWGRAVADQEVALRIDPGSVHARNNFAWLLATCPDDRFRDGRRACELATEACRDTGWREADCLGTLSAAYAECGEFRDALRLLEQAIGLEPEGENAETRQAMLASFRQQRPYRDVPMRE